MIRIYRYCSSLVLAVSATAAVLLTQCSPEQTYSSAGRGSANPPASASGTGAGASPTHQAMNDKPSKRVEKSEKEWEKTLTPEQFRVTRKQGTEMAFGEAYRKFEAEGEGAYHCVCCGSELFTSNEKFHSGCGWPSFYDQSKAKNVIERVDNSHGTRRVEVVCGVCDAHLGHVFDGEGFKTPTDRRYCINGAAITFVPPGGLPPVPTGVQPPREDE
jgi:peptide-methionine (R)-S-oxide reductase